MFFFSSRRRHTRWPRDWSSDVCSSDLTKANKPTRPAPTTASTVWNRCSGRSEERRVGKEGSVPWGRSDEKKDQDTETDESREDDADNTARSENERSNMPVAN